jgi:hypothetical protein
MLLKRNVQAVRSLLLDPRLDPTLRNYHVVTFCRIDKGTNEILQLVFQHPKMQQKREEWIGRALEKACSHQNFEIVKLLVCEYPHPSMFNSQAITRAAETGFTKCVRFLLRNGFDPTIDDNLPLKIAAEGGYQAVVRLLLQQKTVDPSDALPDRPSLQVLKLFYKYCPNKISRTKIDKILELACGLDGDLGKVKLLLKDSRCDPSVNNNICLHNAAIFGNIDIINILLTDPRVGITYELLQDFCGTPRNDSTILKLLLKENHRHDSSAINFLHLANLAEECNNSDIVVFLNKFIQ